MESLAFTSYTTIITLAVLFWLLEGVFPFFRDRFSRKKHAALNLSIAALNLVVLLPSGILLALVLEHTQAWWPGLKGLDLPFPVQTALILVGFDFWMYTWHRMNHKIDFLWRFHSVHHSDPLLDVTTAWRFHVVEIIFSEALRFPVLILLGAGIQELLLYSLIMTPVIELHHSNVSIPDRLDRVLRVIIPSPLMHRLHHSTLRAEHDSNYGSMLSVWDRLLGSFQLKPDIRNMPLGLTGESATGQQRTRALLLRPFRP
ncbi:sterol desaturase family protein [Prosthecochloris sp. ZM_2]|uniref:sterol desaturase family protein n=1 Tax=Prosthecochloris sp. ZM_2 TaxID=2045206 RepID=UPI000DF851CD|nr:sterol desaturase family protein [Prosthecochloris sp. ZM_2]RNA64770.1 sterol desaturase family protein [Prosthecochloris sp. ZM_2]